MTTETKRRPANGFTSETARQAGLKSAETRRARRDARNAERTEAEQELATFLKIDCTAQTLGPAAREAAALIIGRVLAGRVNITDGRNAAALLSKCHEIARLEAGEVTSIRASITLQLSDEERRARLEAVRGASVGNGVAVVEETATAPALPPPPTPAPAPVIDVREREETNRT
jgi:hypothetical protein